MWGHKAGASFRDQLATAFERYLSEAPDAGVRQKYLNSKVFVDLQVATGRKWWADTIRHTRLMCPGKKGKVIHAE